MGVRVGGIDVGVGEGITAGVEYVFTMEICGIAAEGVAEAVAAGTGAFAQEAIRIHTQRKVNVLSRLAILSV